MVSGSRSHVKLLRERVVVDHAAHGAPGLISIHGVRYTTARHTAQQAVDAVFRTLGHATPPRCRTDHTPLAGGGIESLAGFLRSVVGRESASVPEAALVRLAATYGTSYARVLQVARDEPALSAPLGTATAVTGAEIVYAAREEMAMTLADALLRRTEAGSAGHPGEDAVRRAAELMAAEHDWDAARVEQEFDVVAGVYRL
jgi:glycerol-3-phosphate dehydrogenase